MNLLKFDNAVKATIAREGGFDYNTITYLNYAYGIFVIADDCVQDVFVFDFDTDTTAFVAEFSYSEHYEVHEFIHKLLKRRVPFDSDHFLKSENCIFKHDVDDGFPINDHDDIPW